MQQASTKTRAGSNTWLNKLIAVIVCAAMVLSMSSFGKAFAENAEGESKEDDALTTPVTNELDSNQGGSATITIKDAVKGNTYTIYKLFDASVTEDGSGAIYSGKVPEGLESYFEASSTNSNVVLKEGAAESDVVDGIAAWISNSDGKAEGYKIATAKAASSGNLVFKNLKYGYYAMISDIENATVTLTTINENAEIFSKTTTPSAIGGNLKSIVGDKETYGVGDTITYQIQFYAVNIDNTVPDTQQAQITEYIVADSLPDFLDDPTVTSVEIAQSGKTTIQLLDNPDTPRKFVKNEDRVDECKWEYSIPWAYKDESDKEGKLFAIYSKDAIVTLTYTATVNENITNTSAKKNNAKVTHKVSGESLLPPLEGDVDTETGIYGIQKVDEDGVGLGGAVFTIKGLTVLDVYSTDGEILKGVYRVDIYDPKCTHVNNDDTSTGDGNSGDNLSSGGDLVLMSTDEDGSSTTDVDTLNSTTESSDLLPAITNNDSVLKAYHVEPGHESQLYCDDDGYLIIIGLPSDAEIELTEVTAPDGYNALDGPVKDYKLLKDSDGKYLTADTTSETKPTFWGGTRTYFYIATESLNELKSASANFMVKNYKGTLLPITGGAGVTALYVVGGLLIVGAGTALVVRRRRQS